MGKVLKVAAAVVGVAALVIPGVGQFISGTIFGALSAVTGTTGLLAAGALSISQIATVGLMIGGFKSGLSLVTGALGLGPKPPKVSYASTDRLRAGLDPRASRKIVFGRTAANTDVQYQEFTGSGQDTLNTIVTLASHAMHSIDEVWFDEKLAWSSATGIGGAFTGFLGVTTRTEGSPANAFTITGSSSWTASASRMSGLAYLWLRYTLSGENSPFASSVSSRITVRGRGAKLYDPRRDSTVGGAGSHRANDQTTWAWVSDDVGRNPALQLLWYLLGWRIQNPSTGQWKLAVGLGLPVERIDLASFMAAANLCDEPVSLAAGGTEPRYRSDGVFGESDDPSTVFENLLATMNGVLRDNGGKLALEILHNDLGTFIDLSHADVIDGFTWLQTPPIDQNFNIVRGQYVDPSDASLYQPVDYPDVVLPSPDGIDRSKQFNFGMVQSSSQAQRLAKTYLQRAQYPGTFSADFLASAWRCQVGSIVRLTFPALGFTNKLFRVVEHAIRVDGRCPMTLREENAAIYAWSASEAPAVTAAAPISYNPLNDPLLTGIAAAGTTALWPNVSGFGRPSDFADVTAANIAAGFSGQTGWATFTGFTPAQVTNPGANLIFNSSFNLGTLGWANAWNGPYKAGGDVGAYFMTTASNNAYLYTLDPLKQPISPGNQYTFQIYAAANGSSSGSNRPYIYIDWHDAAGAFISSSGISFIAPNVGYKMWSITAMAPSTAACARVVISSNQVATGGGAIFTSKWKLELGSSPTPWSDDATNGALYQSGQTIDSLKPAQIGADVTGSNIAAAIAGQGDLATANRATLAFGDNAIVNSEFTAGGGLSNWNMPDAPCVGSLNLAGWFGKRNVAFMHYPSAALASGVAYDFSQRGQWNAGDLAAQRRNGLSVKQGDNLYARALLGVHRCVGQVFILVFDSGGGLLEAPQWTGGRSGGGSNGDPANFDLVGGSFTVTDSRASTAQFMVRMLGNGGSDPYLFFTEPAFGILPAGQNVLPPYKPGRTDPAADQTSSNTAAAIAGQAATATNSDYSAVTGTKPPSNATNGATTGSNLNSPTYGVLSDPVIYTSLGVAAGIYGQGTGATASTLAELDPTAAANLAAAGVVASKIAMSGAVISLFLNPGASMSFEGQVSTNAGGSSGTLRCQLQASVGGANSWSTFATGSGASVSASEPGVDTASGSFTNSTGIGQVFDFRVNAGRTPGTAGGSVIASQTYIST